MVSGRGRCFCGASVLSMRFPARNDDTNLFLSLIARWICLERSCCEDGDAEIKMKQSDEAKRVLLNDGDHSAGRL